MRIGSEVLTIFLDKDGEDIALLTELDAIFLKIGDPGPIKAKTRVTTQRTLSKGVCHDESY